MENDNVCTAHWSKRKGPCWSRAGGAAPQYTQNPHSETTLASGRGINPTWGRLIRTLSPGSALFLWLLEDASRLKCSWSPTDVFIVCKGFSLMPLSFPICYDSLVLPFTSGSGPPFELAFLEGVMGRGRYESVCC